MAAGIFKRRSSEGNNIERTPLLNYADEQIFSQGWPPYTEMTRRNKGWQVMNTSALAALVVRPSTTAMLTLYNNNTVASKIAFIIDRIFAFNLVNTDAVEDWGVWACIHPTGMTAPTADITDIKSMSGLATAYGGGAIVDTGATVVDNGWFPVDTIGSKVGNTGTVTPGTSIAIPIEGRFVIPPTAAISVSVVASLVGQTFTTGYSWYETVVPMGDDS